jgi:hypothetical protein
MTPRWINLHGIIVVATTLASIGGVSDPTGDALWAHSRLLASMDLDRPTWSFISIAWATGERERHCQVLRRAITARLHP